MTSTLKKRHDEATEALHQLDIGRAVVEVTDSSGVKVRFVAARRAALIGYIVTLENQLGMPPRYHGIGVSF